MSVLPLNFVVRLTLFNQQTIGSAACFSSARGCMATGAVWICLGPGTYVAFPIHITFLCPCTIPLIEATRPLLFAAWPLLSLSFRVFGQLFVSVEAESTSQCPGLSPWWSHALSKTWPLSFLRPAEGPERPCTISTSLSEESLEAH